MLFVFYQHEAGIEPMQYYYTQFEKKQIFSDVTYNDLNYENC